MKNYFRVAHKDTLQGLWYAPDGEFTGLIHGKLAFCKHKELQMPFDESLVGWLSATPTLEELFQWFPVKDLKRLAEHGWCVVRYQAEEQHVKEYVWAPGLTHMVICQKNSVLVETDVLRHLPTLV